MAAGEYCQYEPCGIELIGMKEGSCFCSRSHQNADNYLKRKKKSLQGAENKFQQGNSAAEKRFQQDVSAAETDFQQVDSAAEMRIQQLNSASESKTIELKRSNNMSDNEQNGFNYYRAKYEEIEKAFTRYETKQEALEKELKSEIRELKAENKLLEKENLKISKENAIKDEKHQQALNGVEATSKATFGGFMNTLAQPENLENLTNLAGMIKGVLGKKEEDKPAQLHENDPRSQMINKIIKVLQGKDEAWVTKFYMVFEACLQGTILEQIVTMLSNSFPKQQNNTNGTENNDYDQ